MTPRDLEILAELLREQGTRMRVAGFDAWADSAEKAADMLGKTVVTLNELGRAAHDTAVAKGFYDSPPSVPARMCLIHSEVSEALEEYRDGHMELYFKGRKPEGIPAELADVIIRVVDLATYLGIDLDKAVAVKMAYNTTRPFRHGGKVL